MLIIAGSPLVMCWGGVRLRGGISTENTVWVCLSVLLVECDPGLGETPTDSVEN